MWANSTAESSLDDKCSDADGRRRISNVDFDEEQTGRDIPMYCTSVRRLLRASRTTSPRNYHVCSRRVPSWCSPVGVVGPIESHDETNRFDRSERTFAPDNRHRSACPAADRSCSTAWKRVALRSEICKARISTTNPSGRETSPLKHDGVAADNAASRRRRSEPKRMCRVNRRSRPKRSEDVDPLD